MAPPNQPVERDASQRPFAALPEFRGHHTELVIGWRGEFRGHHTEL
jgi:hypothetical protein